MKEVFEIRDGRKFIPVMLRVDLATDKDLTNDDLRVYVNLLVWEQTGELQKRFKERSQELEDKLIEFEKKGYVQFTSKGGIYIP